ncbi:AAA family ATPase [Streptomyces litchfieldiae]|uniref:Uncharacterized protein n=1 Tax=Streptomyces litchfieldiae TaxID=3075543 RepID=A0ABU2MPX6_9ACTN|nr:AAA family ATPase [Streptomyces sp. DSM 44938]MDT0343560.1 hypothetical protein [Streptomyces sp. DSM 44938]
MTAPAATAVPVLWLCGPPGVGKTAVGWEIYSRLRRSGTGAGYVDIDQLGICYPEPAGDPGRHRMQAENLGSVVANFRAAGARCVVVSGVVDAARGIHDDRIPGAALTVCRLRTGPEELTRRLTGRQGSWVSVEDALEDAAALEASDFADVCVDTSGLPVAEVARRVREAAGDWPAPNGPRRPSRAARPEARAAAGPGGPVLWLCGATGVGTSTVGFDLYLRTLRAGHAAAYLDLDQLGFLGPAPADDPGNHRVRARNLAAVWETYRAAGARRLVLVGPAGEGAFAAGYADALAGAGVTLCRLHAGREELTRRILGRARGGSWAQPGDPLRGRSDEHLLGVAEGAVAQAAALDRAGVGDLRVDTDGRDAARVADEIAARTGWPEP